MFNSGNKIVGKNYKDEYKKKHQSKFLSSDPEVKKRYGVFKIKELFKYEDKQHFQNLYGFDKKQLEEFALPEEKKEKERLAQIQIENQEKAMKELEKQQKIKLEQEHLNYMENMEDLMDNNSEGKIEEEEDANNKVLRQIFSNLLDPNMKKDENSGQEEELYEKKDSKTAYRYKEIISGEQAVQFFAMYGNTTPIKFIFCKKKEQPNKYINRPYELEKIEAKDAIGDYFIISPTGITHVYDPEMKAEKSSSKAENENQSKNDKKSEKEKNANSIKAKTIAEFYTLSDWMYQSTLFDILTRINYFKDYRSFKVMTIWINYHRFKKYFNTRTKLSQKLFLAKPAFVNTMIKCNGQISAIEKIVMHEIYVPGRAWTGKDLIEFDDQQRKVIEAGKNEFKKIVQETFEILHNLYESVKKRLKRNKDIDEIENAKTLQELKNKSMFILKEENKLRKKLIMMADKDKQMFDPFVKTIDLMVIELIYHLNKRTLKDIHKELVKERNDSNYSGIFSLSLYFHEAIVELKPTGIVLNDKFSNLFKCIIECFIEVPRIVSFTKRDMDQIVSTEALNDVEKSLTRVNDLIDDSIKVNLKRILEKSIYYKNFTKMIFKKLEKDFTWGFEKMRDKFENFKKIQIEKETFRVDKYLEAKPKGEVVKKKIEEFYTWLRIDVNEIGSSNFFGIINVDVSSVREDFKNFLSNSIKNMEFYLKEKYITLKEKINKEYHEGDKMFKKTQFSRIHQLSEQMDNVNSYKQKLEKMKKRCEKFDLLSRLLKNFKVEMNSSEEGDPNEIKKSYEKLEEAIKNNKDLINSKKEEFVINLVNDISNNKELIKKYNEEINSGIYVDPSTDKDRMKTELENMERNIENAKKDANNKSYYIKNLDIQIPDTNTIGDLPKLEDNFKLRKQLWVSLINYDKDYNDWMSMTLSEISKMNIEEKVNQYSLTGYNLNKALTDKLEQPDRVCEFYNNKLTKMNEYSATITALSSPSLQERHWKEIFSIISVPWVNMESLTNYTLRDFLETHRIYSHADKIDAISAAAIAQEKIQKDIDKITNDWNNCQFDVQSHGKGSRDKFIIKSVEEINQFLEEHTQLVQSAMNSRYVADIREKVQRWEDDLNLITRVIEEWLQCQRQWIYLENIFSTDDIKRQIPDANKKFTKVNRGFKDLMMKTSQNRLVLERCKQDGLLDMLIRFNIELDSIQKSLEDYLQTKRAAFPRFYFLSNDELLKILSNTRQPRLVQDYLNKCFEGIKTITFASETSNEIISMISPENEEVPLMKSLVAHEIIEAWLLELEETMYQSVYEEMKKCLEGYPEYGISRKDWIFFGYPCQAVLTVDQILWAKFIEDRFNEIQMGTNINALKEFYSEVEKQIFELAELVQTKCPELKKSLVERLIIINVHARQVVADLINQGVSEKTNFEWSKQLKFYYEQDIVRTEFVIRQTNSRFLYGYEYLGNPERMVITPLTDKCYITLTSALHLNYGGAPAGPAGTGKTETTKDLSKAMAVKVNVFNCTDQLDFQMMGRMFCGLAECGAWACFDEFNRIDVEVLSVIAQQIETIQTGIREKRWELDFDGKRIKLKPRFGVFITMNPGYAGRSELPDNLKSLFRPVAMMIPDYALVSEVTLFSKGFKEAKALSIKMFQLFKLSSEQLSKQKHYDFGLRGIKSILSRAGYLKGKFSHETEDKVLIRAMEDSNLPKFLDYDIELFLDIISDLFPKVVVPKVENKVLIDKIKEQLQKENLQIVPRLIHKINQLLDTMMVRLGNMVVGLTGTGKSTTYQTLSKTLTELGKVKELQDPWFCQVVLNILNPKSVTKNELYMSKDIVTQTWEDGIVAKIMRQAEDDEKEEKIPKRKWLCFDGPVDALWIEDMNTVLDDSRKLCLPDGSNIRIPKLMNLVFETNDLRVASPATVSRCGMIYMEPHYVGYIPLIETWNLNYKAKLNKIFEEDGSKKNMGESVKDYIKQVDIYTEHLRQFLPDALKFIRKNCKEMIPTVDVNLVQTFLNLFSSFFNPDEIKLSNDKTKELIKLYFFFCLVWSLGANIEESSRKQFITYMKNYAKSKNYQIDLKTDIYEIFVKEEDAVYSNWGDKLKEKGIFSYNSSISFFNILVPTTDTIKYQYLMNYITKYNLNVLFMGETGVGKSVIIVDFLKNLSDNNPAYLYKSSNFSAKTSSKNVFDTLKSSINKNGNFQPSTGKKFIYFIDDINLPQLDEYGSQQPIEFLRQLIDLKSFYDEKKMPKKIKDVLFMAACAPPSGGRNPVTPRLFRHFHMIWMTELSEDSMKQIFKAIVNGWLEIGPNKSLKEDTDNLINAATFIYDKIRREKLPTPSKSHYTFNLRDLSKVVQGMLQINYENITDRVMLINLWTHETSRQFRDRLLGDDITWFDNLINTTFENKFNIKDMHVNIDKLIFTDIIEKQQYKMVTDQNILNKRINEALERYNIATKFGQMNLVFFTDAINHFCRISRILCQPRGNALLVGMGGSGRQSLTKLVGYILSYQMNNLQMTKGYNTDLFWKDLARILNRSGTSDQKQIFLFSDTQILYESFLEDINNILNNGEVPNLFKEDEILQIFNTLKDTAKSNGYLENKDSVYQYFVSRVRESLRIVLAFSPVGDGFRNRCRQFPSIINCCTIDWFNPWPNDALISVAERYLRGNQYLVDDEELIGKLCKIFVKIQMKATDLSDRFYKELRRAYYITPTSYLEFLKLFDEIHKEKINIIPSSIENYKMGIQKLEEANVIVANLKSDLIILQPKLVVKKDEIKIMIENLDAQKKVVGEEKQKIQADKDVAEIERDRIAKIKDECDTELKQVKPILDEAERALNSLTEDDIFSVKKLNKPPNNLVLLGKCVCFIYESKGLEWADTQRLLSNPAEFISNCKDTKLMISKLNDPRRLKELGTLFSAIENIDYSKVSKVSEGLKKWVGAMLIYVEKWRFVNPRMISLEKATKELEVVEKNLFEKSQYLRQKEAEVEKLTKDFEDANRTLNELQTTMETIEVKLKRAGRLVDGLKDEGKRWKENINNLNGEAKNLLANVILSVAVIAFSGPYTNEYRKEFFRDLKTFISEEGIYLDENSEFSLANMFSDPLTIREWNYSGLPADDLSIDNAIITIRSRRWPLLIDPQMQANKWIKNYFKKDLKSYKISDKNIYNRLKDCISSGYQFLIENVEQTIDSVFEPILQKQLFKQGSGFLINMGGEKPIQYNPTFRLFMTSKMGNPHYLPELSIKVTLINFTVTLKGLEDQLLVEVVKNERIDLEQLKDQLIFQINEDKKTIKEIETDILTRVKDASDDILDSDILVNKLDQSKVKSKAINEKLEKAEKTAKDINKQRKAYRPIAIRGSIIYFVVASLNGIDSMYNYSLEYFLKLFNQRLQKSEKNDNVDKRVDILIDDITISFYEKISRGLFEKDKIVYAFLLLMNILLNDERRETISQREWNFFLRGASMTPDTSGYDMNWIDITKYSKMLSLKECHSTFYELETSFKNPNDIPIWKEYMIADNPITVKLPENIDKLLSDFNKLVLLKTMREEKLIFGVKNFIEKNIGKRFLESPPFSVEAAYEDSIKSTPLIFILSPGANPVNFLKAFGKEKNVKINNLSLGQGQGEIAKNYIMKSRQNGDWVCLENCHLSISWMPKLEEIQEEFNDSEVHPNYRLWLTSMPTKHFPDSILQSGIKITNEPPKGIKQNLKGIFLNIKEDNFEGSNKPNQFKKLLFSLAFFHAVILERRKFGPLGWNIPYEWMNSDFETSKLHLRMYVDEYQEIPLKILHYLVADINYGGRVTDDKDSKLISAILSKYFTELVFDDAYKFAESGIYYAPQMSSLSEVHKYLDDLPLDDDPTVFGLHSNANITLQAKNVKEFLEPLIAIQPRSSSSGSSKKPDDIVNDICIEMDRKIKSLLELDYNKANPLSISDDPASQKKSSLGVFLLQECEKFNTLLNVIKSSIRDLQLAVSGKIVMSATMEKVYNSFLDNQVPKLFEDVSYLCLKPLSSWIIDLAERVNFMGKWLLETKPKSFWISAFFFPQGFNTAVLQTYARKKLEPIDTLTFRTNVLKVSPDKVEEMPEEGLNIHGLFLQGASWNWKDVRLREPDPGELWHVMPVIWFEPIKLYELKKYGFCECPLYKTSKRAGELSTTGHSTNFIMYFYLKCEEEAEHWIRRGSALLTQLDN